MEQENNKVVDWDLFDKFKFTDARENAEREFVNLVDKKKYEEKNITNTSVSDDMLNIFSSLYRKYWDFAEGTGDSELKDYLEELSKTEEFENIRTLSVRNQSAAFAGAMQLMEKFDRVMKEEIKNGKNDPSPQGQAQMRMRIRSAAKQAEGAAEDADSADKAFGGGCGDEDPLNTVDSKEVAERIKRLKQEFGDNLFKFLAKQIGRMKSEAESVQMTLTDKGMIKPIGIEHGGDLSKVLPAELMKYHMSADLFILDWMEKKLQQIKNEGEEHLSGPFVVAQDQSSSMGGTKRLLSCAILWGLWEICKKENRKLAFLPFSSRNGKLVEITGMNDLMDILLSFMGGGTDFDLPLTQALTYIENQPEFEKADLLVITDGEAEISQTTVDFSKKYEGKLRILVAELDELSCDQNGNLIQKPKSKFGGRVNLNTKENKSVFEKVTPKNRIFKVDGPSSWEDFCEQAFTTGG